MDARLDPAKYAGLAEGDAHVIRNAGGRASDDAIRSLVISHKLLGTLEWFVVQRELRKELFSDEVMADLLDDDLGTADFDGRAWSNPKHRGGCSGGHVIKCQTIADQAASVVQDERRVRAHQLVPREIPIYGFVYDVKTGLIDAVEATTKAERPQQVLVLCTIRGGSSPVIFCRILWSEPASTSPKNTPSRTSASSATRPWVHHPRLHRMSMSGTFMKFGVFDHMDDTSVDLIRPRN